MTVDSDTFRSVMGRFATGVTVVTLPGDDEGNGNGNGDGNGSSPHGITVNAFTSLSLDPPLVLICIDHDTQAYRRLEGGADGYGVNLLAADGRELGEYFADMVELEPGPFETEPTRTVTSGAPLFENALGYLDCTVETAHEAGDHTIYVGRVEDAAVCRPDADPLTFYTGKWGTIAAPDGR